MKELTPKKEPHFHGGAHSQEGDSCGFNANQEGGHKRVNANQESHRGYAANKDGGNTDQATGRCHNNVDEESCGIERNKETCFPQEDHKKGPQEGDVRGCCSASGNGARRQSHGLKFATMSDSKMK
jgi:hypothetical protein